MAKKSFFNSLSHKRSQSTPIFMNIGDRSLATADGAFKLSTVYGLTA